MINFIVKDYMTQFQKINLFLLRISVGWFMFYAGITKVLNPDWSAAKYLTHAKTFSNFFMWFAKPEILSITNFINEWGLVFLGVSLILGLFVRISSFFGVLLMILYYFPILEFPYIKPHSFIVDEHIIYALVFLLLASLKAGRVWGLENWCFNLLIFSKFPKLREWIE